MMVKTYTKADVAHILFNEGSSWAILTADQEYNNYDRQSLARLALQSILDYRGYPYLLVDGYCGGRLEQSVLLLDITTAFASELASLFTQEAFICKEGLLYQNADKTDFVLAPFVNRTLTDVCVAPKHRSVIHCLDGDLVLIVEV